MGQLVHFDMTVERDGQQLGGHNVQVVVGAPGRPRYGLDRDVALTLDSGWWVTLRNQFADAPCVALEILESVRRDLSEITAEATEAYFGEADAVTKELFARVFSATGPDYWP